MSKFPEGCTCRGIGEWRDHCPHHGKRHLLIEAQHDGPVYKWTGLVVLLSTMGVVTYGAYVFLMIVIYWFLK